jgi:hypothetical protein
LLQNLSKSGIKVPGIGTERGYYETQETAPSRKLFGMGELFDCVSPRAAVRVSAVPFKGRKAVFVKAALLDSPVFERSSRLSQVDEGLSRNSANLKGGGGASKMFTSVHKGEGGRV